MAQPPPLLVVFLILPDRRVSILSRELITQDLAAVSHMQEGETALTGAHLVSQGGRGAGVGRPVLSVTQETKNNPPWRPQRTRCRSRITGGFDVCIRCLCIVLCMHRISCKSSESKRGSPRENTPYLG